MRPITWLDRLRYEFDNLMSKGPIVLIGWLFLISAIMILVASTLIVFIGVSSDGSPPDFWETAWISLMHALDSGALGGDSGRSYRLAMTFVTFGGIFIVSILIGLLTSGIESKLEDLRKGRSFVVEQNHIVILGWSSQIFTVISELIVANESLSRACIAILADKDKVEMEDELRDKIGQPAKMRLVCRTGSPIDLTNLEIINPHSAKSIIILSPETANPDSQVIKTILTLTQNPQRRATPYHIVAEVREAKNLEVVKLVGGEEVEPILVSDLIARMIVQVCRQSGLSVVYTELLNFSGDEIYFHAEPALVTVTFGEALLAYQTSTVIGLYTATGQVRLNPPMNTVLAAGDKLIVIAEDENKIRLNRLANYPIETAAIRQAKNVKAMPEHTLILGWNRLAVTVINELDNYVAVGSQVTVMADVAEASLEINRRCNNLQHQQVAFEFGDTTDRQSLSQLNLSHYQHIIVLSYSDELDVQEADARTLVTLLHLRNLSQQQNTTISITSEMLDVRNRQLAEITRADDFIVSDRLISLIMAQIAENKGLARVFAELFTPEGSELYLRPVHDYVKVDEPVTFYTIIESVSRQNQVAIGYRLRAQANDANHSYGVKINPDKAQKITFTAQDQIVIVVNE